jgi:hypothetical protein
MAAFEVIALDTATPQLRAPGAADTYTFPRAVEMPLGTANGVLYLNGSKVVTSGSGLTFDGFDLAIGNAGGLALFKRASDGLSVGRVGSRSGTDISVFNAGGVTAEFVAGANELRFNVAAAEQMRLTSTGLGIGTSSPAVALHLGAGRSFQVGSTTDYVRLTQPNTNLFGILCAPKGDYSLYFNTSTLDVVQGNAALATNATGGFFYVAGCAGTPTGTPTAYTGRVPIVVDTTNNKLYFYSGGAWRDAGP